MRYPGSQHAYISSTLTSGPESYADNKEHPVKNSTAMTTPIQT
jgi:hypothetical protein